MPANGGRSGGRNNNKKSDPILENLRGACPPHKRKDLDKLYKSMNGDEDKIMEKIQQWWEEPAEEEEVWEDVNKKNLKKKIERGGGRGGGRTGPGRGRGRGAVGGRGGGGRERGGRGRGPPPKREAKEPKTENIEQKTEEPSASAAPAAAPVPATLPAPVSNAPALKGAWGARAAAVVPPAAPSAATEPPKKAPQPKEEPTKLPETNPLDVGLPAQSDPTPSGLSAPESKSKTNQKPVVRTTVRAGGNVWATKGSAHLIQAEKPAPVPVAPPAPAPVAPIAVESQPGPPMPSVSVATLESGLPPSVSNGAWGKSPAPEPMADPIAMPPPPSVPIPAPAQVVVPVPETKSAPPPPSPAAPANILKLGQWETGDAADSQQLDFGFGSFGAADNDAGADAATTPAKESEAQKAATVSPARPPPGLSLGAMPPMPDSVVMVHELENKMEATALNGGVTKDPNDPKSIASSLPNQPVPQTTQAQVLAGAGVAQQNYNQYGMPGMYNYNAAAAAAGSGFVGMTPAGPVLAGGVVPQPGKPQTAGINQGLSGQPTPLPQQGLYGSQPPSAPSSGNAVSDASNDAAPTPTTTGLPPGMPGAMPYANPALAAHYGQHQFYMGQPQGGIGYNYGYGQFGGVAQGGFGYQQVMGQSQGYGAPHYDDPSQQNSHQSGGSGGYHKGSGGGYRGRNNPHNTNQYQNQYNPQQHGDYGGQPHGMGYYGDHFNQRGGYGPGGMADPYSMQQGMHAGGFQDNDHQKGKKGGRGNSSLQQGPPHQRGQQQGFSAQGQTDSAPSSGGWSNNQAGGWSGGTPSWQGNN